MRIVERYGLITQAANPRTNPDALPIGLTKTVVTEGRWKGDAVGVNCAICHTGQLTYQGKQIRIDGGVGNTFDFMAYIYALDDALQATLTDTAKFDRLAARLGASSSDCQERTAQALRERRRASASVSDPRLVAPIPWGPSRIDAIAVIVNRLVSTYTRNSRELVHSPGTHQTPFRLEFPAGVVDPMARRATGSDQTQPGRDYGRFHADGSDIQDAPGWPFRFDR